MARRKRKNANDESSNDEVTPRVKSHPRKKQAVTKTNSSAVKALIRKNATTSPLLLLPSEVRENILTHLVGDKLIHVKYLDGVGSLAARKAKAEILEMADDASNSGYDIDDSDNEDEGRIRLREPRLREAMLAPSSPATFRHAICVATQSEQSAYEEAVSGNADVPEDESPESYVASCKERHASCKMCGSGPMYLLDEDRRALRIHLNVLGVCRQLYEEANHLLWATNTFSFDDPKTLEKFYDSLNRAQKRNLTSIHISADIGGYYAYSNSSVYQRSRWDSSYWGKVLKISNLNVLRGVQTLYLCLNQLFGGPTYRNYRNDLATEQMLEKAQQSDIEILLRLRALPLKHVTVIVSDDAENAKSDAWKARRWTAKKKNEHAEGIRVQLVDPSGADLVKKEAEAASLARKTEIRDNAADSVKQYKALLKDRRAAVVRLTNMASGEEEKASLATEKANCVSNQSSKKAVKLRDAADSHKRYAVELRRAVDDATERVKQSKELLATAREEHKGAMVRLGLTPQEIEDEEELERILPGSSGSDMDIKSEDDEPVLSSPSFEEDDEVSD